MTLDIAALVSQLHEQHSQVFEAWEAAGDAVKARGGSLSNDPACTHLSALMSAINLAADLGRMVRDAQTEVAPMV